MSDFIREGKRVIEHEAQALAALANRLDGAFCAGLAVALAEGKPLYDAVTFGNGAGALATTVMGSSTSMPQRDVLDRFLATAR